MRMKVRRRKAQAEIIGAIFFIVLAMIVFSLFMALIAAQYSLARQAAEAQLVIGYRADESLAVSLNAGSVQVRNNGPATAVITYYIGVNAGEQQSILGLGTPVEVAPRGTSTILVSPSFQSIGVVTSFGNVWWN